MKILMKEMAVSIRNNIVDTMKTQTTIKETTNLTPISPTEPITQSPHPTPQVEKLNNLIGDMNIEKSPKKRNVSTPSNENENQEEQKESIEDNSDSARKNKERAAARKSRLNKIQSKGHKQS